MNRGVNIKAMGFDERGVQRWRIPVALEWRDPDNVVEQLCSESGQSSAALFRKKVL